MQSIGASTFGRGLYERQPRIFLLKVQHHVLRLKKNGLHTSADLGALVYTARRVGRLACITFQPKSESSLFDLRVQRGSLQQSNATRAFEQNASEAFTYIPLHQLQLYLGHVVRQLKRTSFSFRVDRFLRLTQEEDWNINKTWLTSLKNNPLFMHPSLPVEYLTTILYSLVRIVCISLETPSWDTRACSVEFHQVETTNDALSKVFQEVGIMGAPFLERLVSRKQSINTTSLIVAFQFLSLCSQAEAYFSKCLNVTLYPFSIDSLIQQLYGCLKRRYSSKQNLPESLSTPEIITLFSTVVLIKPSCFQRTALLAWLSDLLMVPEITEGLMSSDQFTKLLTEKTLPDALTLWTQRQGTAALTITGRMQNVARHNVEHERAMWLKLYQLSPGLWIRRFIQSLHDLRGASYKSQNGVFAEERSASSETDQTKLASTLSQRLLLSHRIMSLVESVENELSLLDVSCILTAYSHVYSCTSVWDGTRVHRLMTTLGNQAVRFVDNDFRSLRDSVSCTSFSFSFIHCVTLIAEAFAEAQLLHQDFFLLLSKKLLKSSLFVAAVPLSHLIRLTLSQTQLHILIADEIKQKLLSCSTPDAVGFLSFPDLVCYALLILHPQWFRNQLIDSPLPTTLLHALTQKTRADSTTVCSFETPLQRFLDNSVLYTYALYFGISFFSVLREPRNAQDAFSGELEKDCRNLVLSCLPPLMCSFGLGILPTNVNFALEVNQLHRLKYAVADVYPNHKNSAYALLAFCVEWLETHAQMLTPSKKQVAAKHQDLAVYLRQENN